MKSIWVAIIIAAGFALPAAADAKKPITQWSCTDFVGPKTSSRPECIYWATGVAKAHDPKTATIDIVETDKIIPSVSEVCKKDPQAFFWQTVKAEWKKVEKAVERAEKKM